MKKNELRNIYFEKRKALSHDEVLFLSGKIFENFIANFPAENGQKVHLFLNIDKFKEVKTEKFIRYFWENKIRVFVPKVVGDTMISVELNPETELFINKWGIPEPAENEDCGESSFDIIIVPLLYCDAFGNRVGYGKGFYDRFFSELKNPTIKIGLNFFPPNEKIDDVFIDDVPLDYLVTPDAVLSFGNFTSKSTK